MRTSEKTKATIRKWYDRLDFPSCYDAEFENAVNTVTVPDGTAVEEYDKECKDGKKNLLSFLYMCEEAERRAKERGISDEVITDTLNDIVVWTEEWSGIKGELYLGSIGWLSNHLKGRLYKLGRLQFCMERSERDIPSYGISAGDNVIEVHIQGKGRLDIEECERSFEKAKEFFARYFPEHRYSVFTCDSWLLDPTLSEYLSPESNIIRFGNMFDRVGSEESNALIKYLFPHDMTEERLPDAAPTSSLAAKVKDAILSGKSFNQTLGVIKK